MTQKQYQLVVQQGPHPGEVYPLRSDEMIIGRDPIADIMFWDPEVSRQHVRLVRVASGYQIQDVGSTNGTFINGQRLQGDFVDLVPGQEIGLGSKVVLLYREVAESEADEPEETADEGDQAAPEAVVPPPAVVQEPKPTAPLVLETAEITADSEETADRDDEIIAEVDEAITAMDDADDADAAEGEVSIDKLQPLPNLSELSGTPLPPPDDSPLPLPTYQAPPPPPTVYSSPPASPRAYDPPPPESPQQRSNTRRLVTIVAIVLFVLLCCCCSFIAFMYYWGGDWLLEQLGLLP